jgi:hypothetical protein
MPAVNLLSVATVAARWVDCLQLLEVELGNGVELLRQPRPFQAGRQVVQPDAVFILQRDECRYRRRPALGPRRGAPRGRRAAVPAKPGTVFAWRSAGVIGTAPMRRLAMFSPSAPIVTVTIAS